MKIKKKFLYRVISGFLSAITFTTSVLPVFAFDKLPQPYDGTNPYVIEEQEQLSEEAMLSLLETLKKPYEIAPVEEIGSVPDSEYVLECEEATGEEIIDPQSEGKAGGFLKLFSSRRSSNEIEINPDISVIPNVNSFNYSYSFDSLTLSETCADAAKLKKVVISLDGENFSLVLNDISTTGTTWDSGTIDYSFEPERVYRFVIEYTYEKNDNDVSGNDNPTGDVSGNDNSNNDVSGGDVSGGELTETEVKKAYSVPFMLHKVRAGETLKTISLDTGVAVKTIKSDNEILRSFVKKGSLLFIRNPKADFVPPFEWNDEVIEKVTKLGAPKGTEFAYDAVNLATLNLLYEEEDIAVKEKEAFALVRYFYSGMPEYKGTFGYGISSLFDERVIDLSDDKKLVILQDMQGIIVNKTGESYTDVFGEYTLKETEDGYSLTDLKLNYTLFDLSGRVASKGTKKGELYRVEYDEDGNLKKLVSKAGKEFLITLNEKGLISEIENPDGTQKTYEYSAAGTLLKLTNERSFNRLYSFDESKRLLSAKNPMGKSVITVSYDAVGRISTYTDAEGHVSKFSQNDNAILFTDAKDNTVTYFKDENNRHNRVLYADGKEENKTFDNLGNILLETDKAGNTRTYTYDSFGHLLSEACASGITATYTYDANGNLLSEKDANGNVTTYEYDDNNNPVLITYPDSTKAIMTFDEAGRMTSVTTGESTITYGYPGNSYNISKVTDSKGGVTENSYDEMDRLVASKEGDKTTTYEYSPTGKLVKEISPDGKTESYEYDAADNSIGVTDPSGNRVGMRYDAMGRIVQVINADGSHTDFSYDANGNLLKEISSDGSVTTYTYDANDEVTSEESSGGESITYERDALGRVIKETYKDGTEVTYEYHPELGLLTKKKDELGRIVTYEYDKVGNLLKESYSNGQSATYTYDSMNRKTGIIDVKGIKTTYLYDANGNILKETEEKNGKTREKSYEYDTNNNMTKETDYDGKAVSFEYDSNNRLVKVKDALGYTTSYTYGAGGETLSETDRNGNTKYYEYDDSGNLIKQTDAAGNVYLYAYDSEGRVTTTTMPDGTITGAVYNSNGYLAKKVDPYGNIEEYTYDDAGNVLSIKNAEGAISTYTYDHKGNKLTETMPNGRVTKYTYNKLGWLTKVTYDNGTYAVYSYDYNGKVVKLEFSNGQFETYDYDSIGNLLTHTTKDGNVVRYTYDDFGQILSVSDSGGTREEYTYTAGGKCLSKVDQLGRKVDYEYDVRGALLKTVDSFGAETNFEYDGNENIVKITERYTSDKKESKVSGNEPATYDEVRVTTFEFDQNNNLITTVYPDGNVERSTFDYNGNPLTVTDKNGNTIKNTYDALGNLIKSEAPTGDVVYYGYDKLGNPSYVKDSLGNVTSYTYDSMGMLTETTLPNGAKTKYSYDKDGNLLTETNALSQTVRYEYNLDGNVVKKIYPNGIYETYEYDEYMRVKTQTNVHGLKTSYEYDSCGNVTKVLTEVASHSYSKTEDTDDVSANSLIRGNKSSNVAREVITTIYSYDELHRLVKEETEGLPATTYEYDKYGNIEKQSNGRNESLSKYDIRGNLIWSKTASGLESTYKYDKADNLLEVNCEGRTVRYEYDKVGNIVKIINPDKSYSTTEYDPLGRPVSEKNELGNVTSYTYDAAGNVLTITDALNRTSSYEYDSVGNLTKEIHVDGTITTYGYDAIGTLIKTTDADNVSVFYTYDEMGNLAKETICDEEDYYAPVSGKNSRRESVYEYTKTGELKSRGGSGSDRERYTYYKDGTLKEVKYPSGKSIGYEYDNFGRNTITYHNGKVAKENTYNEFSELVKATDENGISEYTYDNLGRLIRTKNQAGEVKYTYDPFGNKESITYPDNKKVRYKYDISNRISSVTDVSGLKTEFTYDALGNVLTKTQSDGLKTEIAYDALGRKTEVTTKKATSEITSFEYSYDVSGRMVGEKSKDAEGVLFKSYEYDKAGKLTRYAETRNEEYFNNGFEILRSKKDVSVLDVSGNNGPDVSSNVSDNTSIEVSFDDILRSHKDIQIITYEYDTFGNRTAETEYKDGLKLKSKFIYDSKNRLEKKETNNKKAEEYKYDKDGNLISIEKPGETKTFTYTIDNKLKDTYVNGSLSESATYDTNGLKVTSTLKKEYNVTVTDITVKKEETKGKTGRYTVPYEEKKTHVDTHTEITPGTEGYEYSEFVAEHEDDNMQWLADFVGVIAPTLSDSWHKYADGLTTEEYQTVTVDGTEPVEKEIEELSKESVSGFDSYVKRTPGSVKETKKESSHEETRTYYEKSYLVYDMTLSNPQVLSEQSDCETSRVNYTYAGEERLSSSSLGSYVYDGRGSVKKVVNGSTVVRDYEYDPYGNITKGAPLQERIYGYNGEEYTPQSGLIYLRARHYNPSTATFISEDTYAGDKTDPVTRNRYSFANNNPVMYQDPSGHAGLFSKVVGAVKSVATTVTKTVAKAANTVTTKVTTVAKTVANKVTAKVQETVSKAKTVVSTVKSAVSNVATKVTNGVKKVVNDAKVAVKNATTAVVNVAKNVVNVVVNTVTTFVNDPVSFIENGAKAIASHVENAKTVVTNTCNSVKSYVAEKVQTVTTKASDLWEEAKDLSHKVMARCETAVAEKVEKASRWWQDTKESVKTAVEKTQNFVEKIGNSIKEGLNDCATKVKEGLKVLTEGAKGVWNAVTNFVDEHPFLCTAILIVGLAALSAFTGGAASAILLAATKGAIMGAFTGFGTGVVTASIKRLIYGDSYSFDDAVHDVGKSTFGGALTGAITSGYAKAVSKIANKGVSGSKTYMTGKEGEEELARLVGGKSQQYRKTSLGGRYIDQLSADKIAHESKVGYTTLTKRIRTQILKDSELINTGSVEGANWHFFTSGVTGKGGASQPLLDFLTKNGISYTIH